MTSETQEEQETSSPTQGENEPAEESFDQSSEETQNTPEESSEAEQSSRAEARIKELNARANQNLQEAEYWRQVALGQEPNPYGQDDQYSGQPSSQSITPDQIAETTSSEVEKRLQMREAEQKHKELREDDTFASAVAGAWMAQGGARGSKTMDQIASELKQRGQAEGERKATAEQAEKLQGSSGTARKSSKGTGSYSRDDISKMSDEEFERNEKEIFEKAARGEL